MKLHGQDYQTIWRKPDDPRTIQIIDQHRLPFELYIEDLHTVEDAAHAIRAMHVRGAPLIGATAAYGMYLAALQAPPVGSDAYFAQAAELLLKTRPTAVDLFHATRRSQEAILKLAQREARVQAALAVAEAWVAESIDHCRRIGVHGLALIREIADQKQGPVNILTHCNAGWLACIDYGTATSPIYQAHDAGIEVHVWVDETRPRNQGSRLTAYELGQHGIPHRVITDNTGGLLMQRGLVDICFVGSDRTTRQGDVANKIGTYLKALAAHDNRVPFYVTLPHSSFDFELRDGVKEIEIEERDEREVKYVQGLGKNGIEEFLICPEDSPAANYGFDVTPARLVSGLITERGICPASERGILGLYPEYAASAKSTH